ncbi:MAG: very short patch repair endonuclease [Acidimicrobiales bacterium]
MSRMPRSSTMPELALRKALHRAGLRFRVNVRGLPGTPDIVFTRARIAVFVDGCYWHACPKHSSIPKSNTDWWVAKFEENRARDRRKDDQLRSEEWLPIHIWEHQDVADVVDFMVGLWGARSEQDPSNLAAVSEERRSA